MGLNVDFGSECAVAEYLDQAVLLEETGFNEFFRADFRQVLGLSQFCKDIQIDSLVLYAIDVLEAMLGRRRWRGI